MKLTEQQKEEKKYPICPECGCNTLVGYTPPKEPVQSELLGTPEYVDWEKAHLYCCNGEKDCKYSTRFVDLTTPMTEPKYSILEDKNKEIVEMIEKEFETQEINGIKQGRLAVGKEWLKEAINKLNNK